ncbi:siderophore-interacting protein [Demequina oxidasica]|uniref:siderophore-interacting protein n=1 Tax=Demequina oxidasica TaxID=676199 RepID=UPI0007837A6C|nr:siderophore-interacting protein [Demequina oxidasica]
MTESFYADVLGATQITPNLRRVHLGGGTIADWESTGKADEFVHVHIPGDNPAEGWEDDHDIARHYTIRSYDAVAGTIDLDVVTHGHGLGSSWAKNCQSGDRVAISDASGFYGPPEGSTKRLLLADATGLPAVARILEEASADEEFDVIVELLDLADKIELPSKATVRVVWRVSGNGRSPSALETCMSRAEAPGEDVYVWIACESAESRRARKYLRTNWGRHHTWYRIVGYWYADLAEIMETYNALSDEQRAAYEAIWDDERSDEENWEELEPFLVAHGL